MKLRFDLIFCNSQPTPHGYKLPMMSRLKSPSILILLIRKVIFELDFVRLYFPPVAFLERGRPESQIYPEFSLSIPGDVLDVCQVSNTTTRDFGLA